MVMPATDAAMAERAAGMMARRAGVNEGMVLLVEDVERLGFVAITNQAFERTKSEFFGYVAQDAFAGRKWLALGLKALTSHQKSLFAFNDGKWMGALAAFGLARREWVLKQYGGAFFYPGYTSHYADAELSVLALNDQGYCYDPNSVLVEVDWDKDSTAVNADDRQCFRERVVQGFGGKVTNSELLGLYA